MENSETWCRVVAKLIEMMYTNTQLMMAHQQEVLQWLKRPAAAV